ncbi:MAG TPA: LacI family DNA-binding transcriptional regulator [Vicinamibacterales bacterium]|nr:LacI family DNA-binding transcriptional regulator [Vicinamibacterales bacterium]
MGTFPKPVPSYESISRGVKDAAAAIADGQPRAKPPTILDLAAHAGVSKTTVSRVLNGAPSVAPAIRSRVLDAVVELGFQVNVSARALRTSRTELVGLLVPVISIFGLIVEALDEQLANDGFSILLTSSRRTDPGRDIASIETLVSRGVDALVIAPSDDRSRQLKLFLQGIRTPVVLLDREVRGLKADAVLIDQEPGIAGAVDYLAANGRSRIGLLVRDGRTRSAREIRRSYERQLERHGLPLNDAFVAEFPDLDHQAGQIGVQRLLDAGVDGLISTGTMEHTASVLEQLGTLQVAVPQDLSLVIYGHTAAASTGVGRLPMVAYPVHEIARAVRTLLAPRLARAPAPARVEMVKTVFVGPRG